MIQKLEQMFNIAMVNIEIMEQEITNGKVQSAERGFPPQDSSQVRNDSGAVAPDEQYLLGVEGAGDQGSPMEPIPQPTA